MARHEEAQSLDVAGRQVSNIVGHGDLSSHVNGNEDYAARDIQTNDELDVGLLYTWQPAVAASRSGKCARQDQQ